MFHTPTIVVNPPQTNQGSVLGRIVAESCLGQILEAVHLAQLLTEIAALRKQQHAERLQTFLTHRKDAAKRCREAVLGTTTVRISSPEKLFSLGAGVRDNWQSCAARSCQLGAKAFGCDISIPNQDASLSLTPYERRKVKNTNWCPTCQEYVSNNHNTPKGLTCEKYIRQRAQREAKHLAKMREQTRVVFTRKPLEAWKYGPINTNYVEAQWLARIAVERGDVEEASPTAKVKCKPKRHYVRHVVADLQFVRQQDVNLATNI